MRLNTMGSTKNRFKHDGVWYIAVEQDGCRNCAFKTGKSGCKVTFQSVPACRKEERKDNRSVIFVESDADNFGDEELTS